MTTSDRDQIIDRLFDAADPHLDDVSGFAEAGPAMYDDVIVPLLAEARREGAEQALRAMADELDRLKGTEWGSALAGSAWIRHRADKITKGEQPA